MYNENLDEFNGQRVVDFNGAGDWEGPDVTYRLRCEYDDKKSIQDRLDELLAQNGAGSLSGLIIGSWMGVAEGGESDKVIGQVAAAAPRLPHLRALFIGEMSYEECELSWINQADVTPVLAAFPRLEVLRIRGGNGLAFSRIRHEALRELAIETGGLPRSALHGLFLCEFPELERLELLLGESNYGFDGTVADLQPLLAGRLFPRLKYLGLMNSEIANDIAAAVANAPIVKRIETLDLSMGNLDNEGLQSLQGLADKQNLKRVVFWYHYATDDALAKLVAALPCEVVAGDRQDPDDEWRPILHAE